MQKKTERSFLSQKVISCHQLLLLTFICLLNLFHPRNVRSRFSSLLELQNILVAIVTLSFQFQV